MAGKRQLEWLTTPKIEEYAKRLGANEATIKCWRYRGVPLAWRIAICQASKGRIALKSFKNA